MAKTERQKLDKQCLDLWSKCVRTRFKTCKNCGEDTGLHAHHIVQKTYKLSRYNVDNGLTLCAGCHFVEKTDPERFRETIIGILGEEDYLARQKKYRVQWKWSIPDLKEILKDLKQQHESLKSDWGSDENKQ